MGPDEATVIAVGDDGNLCIAGRLRNDFDFDGRELRPRSAKVGPNRTDVCTRGSRPRSRFHACSFANRFHLARVPGV